MVDEIGLIELGCMGRNIAANMVARNIVVRSWDHSAEALAADRVHSPDLAVCNGIADLVGGQTRQPVCGQ